MGARSKYRDKTMYEEICYANVEAHPVSFNTERAYDSRTRSPSHLHDLNGDWCWKPERDSKLGKDFVTFRGVAPGAAELYRTEAFPRS